MEEVKNVIKKDNLVVPNNIMTIKKLKEKRELKSNDMNECNLPEGWVEMIDKKTGKVYCANKKTRKSQWSKQTGDI
jgi:predicted lipoprotein with Yx(FWY)xxD motif